MLRSARSRLVADRVGTIDVAVLFAGAARVPAKDGGRPLTFTSQRAAAAAELLAANVVIPAHLDSWAHFSEGLDDFVAAFDEAGIGVTMFDRLFISPRTVQAHLTHVYTKLDLTSWVKLVQEAARHG